MNIRTKVLVVTWVAFTAFIAWRMTAPDYYRDGAIAVAYTPPYHWNYPIIAFIFGGVIIALLRPWRDAHSFWGASVACVISLALGIMLFFGAMHSPPVHGTLLLATLLITFSLLFYCGYSFAYWRRRTSS